MSHPPYSLRNLDRGRTISSVNQSSPIRQIAEVHAFAGRKVNAQIGIGPIGAAKFVAFRV